MKANLQRMTGRKESRYFIAGTASVIIEYASFALLILFAPVLGAHSISFIIGIAVGFVFHKVWSFAGQQQFKTRQQLMSYCLLALLNFFATNFIINLLVKKAQLEPLIAKLITMAVVAAWSYAVFNLFIFRTRRSD